MEKTKTPQPSDPATEGLFSRELERPWPCLRARCQAAWTDKDHEKGGGFDGILYMELLSNDNVDLSVRGVELTKGEGPEGKREPNCCTYF